MESTPVEMCRKKHWNFWTI